MIAANKTVFDENNRPKITKDEIEKGMLNMIYRGMIPKFADLTPGFNRHGNPIKTSSNMKDLYGKYNFREEIETENINNIKYNFEQGLGATKNFFITDKDPDYKSNSVIDLKKRYQTTNKLHEQKQN